MSKLTYRLLERSDHRAAAALHETYLGVHRDDTFFEWKYWSCPGGPHRCVLAVDEETGAVAGSLGSIPVAVRCFGATAPAYFDVDIIVAERPDRLRIFFRIYRERLEYIRNSSAPLLPINCAFTIPKTLKITTKLWRVTEVAPAPKNVRVLRHARILQERLRPRWLAAAGGAVLDAWSWIRHPTAAPRGISVDEAGAFDESADRLWDAIKDYHNVWTVRDAAYLNWRYVAIPHVRNTIFTVRERGDLIGYLVVNFQDPDKRAGVIQDFQYIRDRKDAGRALVHRALAFLRRHGSALAITWTFRHSYCYPVLAEFGFAPRETTGRSLVVRKAYELPPGKRVAIPEAQVLDHRNWFLSKGDADDD